MIVSCRLPSRGRDDTVPPQADLLGLIALARAAGFSLDEITGMLGPDGRPSIDRLMLTAKAQELDVTIRRLTALRDSLRHAADCPAPSHQECPTFRRILRAASTGSLRAPGRRTPRPR
ncbi:MerR family transcriptional regulator [Streptomyces sp. CB01881]|nr:MerR family transcriptional regulator [Streptomyces sp. CB01881]TYC76410.1 MerR family transcriptional regulator [Streptomyces sp. CB01881]